MLYAGLVHARRWLRGGRHHPRSALYDHVSALKGRPSWRPLSSAGNVIVRLHRFQNALIFGEYDDLIRLG